MVYREEKRQENIPDWTIKGLREITKFSGRKKKPKSAISLLVCR
jgi:hypothetical protein